MDHHFTVDVEEYFQVSAFEHLVAADAWDHLEQRADRFVRLLLDLLAAHAARATFFILGWLANRNPGLVRAIADDGHEIASHGWDHRRVTDQSPPQFRASVRRTKCMLEDVTGDAVLGFRAPSYSIVPGREWALDVLIEEGHVYDSSLFPVWRPDAYGYPGGLRDPHWLRRPSGALAEVPPTTWRRSGVSLPAAGGAYFRLLPYAFIRAAFDDCERRGAPGTFYIHPWELDPAQPRMPVGWVTRVRHYGGIRRTQPRLERLLSDFRFTTIAQTVERL